MPVVLALLAIAAGAWLILTAASFAALAGGWVLVVAGALVIGSILVRRSRAQDRYHATPDEHH